MTEDEAKTKWCPFTRPGGSNGCNRSGIDNKCIGSDCMMWRWEFVETEESRRRRIGNMMFPVVEPVYEKTSKGHCGLARGPL